VYGRAGEQEQQYKRFFECLSHILQKTVEPGDIFHSWAKSAVRVEASP
jgi:hypothetical protein